LPKSLSLKDAVMFGWSVRAAVILPRKATVPFDLIAAIRTIV